MQFSVLLRERSTHHHKRTTQCLKASPEVAEVELDKAILTLMGYWLVRHFWSSLASGECETQHSMAFESELTALKKTFFTEWHKTAKLLWYLELLFPLAGQISSCLQMRLCIIYDSDASLVASEGHCLARGWNEVHSFFSNFLKLNSLFSYC